MVLPPERGSRYRYRHRKRSPLRSTIEALGSALGKMGLSDQARRLQIFTAWPEAVGPEIAARTAPDGFSRGVLTIKAPSAAWRNELTFLKESIIDNLNRVLGSKKVREIKVINGRLPKPAREPPPKWMSEPVDTDDLSVVQETAAGIQDDEVRRAFSKAMELHRRAERVIAASNKKSR